MISQNDLLTYNFPWSHYPKCFGQLAFATTIIVEANESLPVVSQGRYREELFSVWMAYSKEIILKGLCRIGRNKLVIVTKPLFIRY
jgi:hypothetical protein